MGVIVPLYDTATNSFVLRAAKTVLIDAGLPNYDARIINAMRANQIDPQSIDYILLTHGHYDHTGSAIALREQLDAPIVIHAGDVPLITATSFAPPLPLGWEGRLLGMMLPSNVTPTTPDIILNNAADYDNLGIGGEMLHTPGHSDGSISLIFDDAAIVGDVLRSGILNVFFSQRPRLPFFLERLEDTPTLLNSIEALLNTSANTFFVGHGRALSRANIEAWFETIKV